MKVCACARFDSPSNVSDAATTHPARAARLVRQRRDLKVLFNELSFPASLCFYWPFKRGIARFRSKVENSTKRSFWPIRNGSRFRSRINIHWPLSSTYKSSRGIRDPYEFVERIACSRLAVSTERRRVRSRLRRCLNGRPREADRAHQSRT